LLLFLVFFGLLKELLQKLNELFNIRILITKKAVNLESLR